MTFEWAPSFLVNLEGENTVCLSTHALTGFRFIVSSFKLGDEISSSKTWSKRFAIFEIFVISWPIRARFANWILWRLAQPRQAEVLFRGRGSIQELTRCVTSAEIPDIFGFLDPDRPSENPPGGYLPQSSSRPSRAGDRGTRPEQLSGPLRTSRRDGVSVKAAVKKLMKRAPGRRRPSPRRSPRPNRWRCR